MGIQVTFPFQVATEKDIELNIQMINKAQEEMRQSFMPAEWYMQSCVQMTWPHAGTDWKYMLDEVQQCFKNIAKEIAARELLLIVTPEPEEVYRQLENEVAMDNVRFFECPTNDTWARDHGAISIIENSNIVLEDFKFNGWGLKYPADKDNLITRKLCEQKILKGHYYNRLGFVLEGGSIESDGAGTLLTTSQCLLSPNRNGELHQGDIEEYLKRVFHLERVLWLDYGFLAGDDTDSHIDTLARFCSSDTIAYVKCDDESDEHYNALKRMEEQLESFKMLNGNPYRLLPLPMAEKIIVDGERLPATYANFLILNDAVLYPTYNQEENDKKAEEVLRTAFPNRDIIGIDCCPLIKQHGSLHCVTMQYPKGVVL